MRFIEHALKQKGHLMYKGSKKEKACDRLGTEHLYEILATNNYSDFSFVTASHITHLYAKAKHVGFSDEFLQESRRTACGCRL